MSLQLFLRDYSVPVQLRVLSYDREHDDLTYTSSFSKSSSWYDGAYKNVSKCLLVEAKGSFYAFVFKQLLDIDSVKIATFSVMGSAYKFQKLTELDHNACLK